MVFHQGITSFEAEKLKFPVYSFIQEALGYILFAGVATQIVLIVVDNWTGVHRPSTAVSLETNPVIFVTCIGCLGGGGVTELKAMVVTFFWLCRFGSKIEEPNVDSWTKQRKTNENSRRDPRQERFLHHQNSASRRNPALLRTSYPAVAQT